MSQPNDISDLPTLPPRPVDGHKGTFGTVIVVGGSPTMPGAPAMAARAALRSGVGLVKIAATGDVLASALILEPSATGITLTPEADNTHAINQADPDVQAVLAIGPGLGQSAAAAQLVESLLLGSHAIVLDADGLNLLAKSTHHHPASGSALVLTPHPGEYRRLAKRLGLSHDPTDPDQRTKAAEDLALAHHAVVILKGPHSVISDGTHTVINRTGNPALATAGTGDVLTGLIASLIAQGMDPLDAAVLGTHVHGHAGDLWAKTQNLNDPTEARGLLARELADLLPLALAHNRSI